MQVPSVNREFIFVDATLLDALVEGLTLRGELMLGKDRVPTTRTVSGVTVPRFTRPRTSWATRFRALTA